MLYEYTDRENATSGQGESYSTTLDRSDGSRRANSVAGVTTRGFSRHQQPHSNAGRGNGGGEQQRKPMGGGRTHDGEEGGVSLHLLGEVAGVQELGATEGGDGPVVVLARAVHAGERLLVQKGTEAVLGSNLLHDLHDHQVVVGLLDHMPEERGELVLVGSHLAMAGLERNAELVALLLNFLHAREDRLGRVDRRHVVGASLLVLGRVRSENGAAAHLEIGALVVCGGGNEEQLLLEADVGEHAGDVVAEELEEAGALGAHGALGAVERSLLIESQAGVGHKASRDEDRVGAQEDRRLGVDGEVSAGGVSGAEAAVGEGASVGLATEQMLALQLPDRLAHAVELKHGVLHLAGLTVALGGAHGLEPMAIRVGAIVLRPLEDGGSNLVGDFGLVDPHSSSEVVILHALLAKVLLGHGAVEAVLAEALEGGRAGDDSLRHRRRGTGVGGSHRPGRLGAHCCKFWTEGENKNSM